MIFGGDFSSWQGEPDFAGLKGEGIVFAFHKGPGEGNYVSPVAARNIRACHDAGLITGIYDWTEPQSGMAGGDMARDFLRTAAALGHRAGDLLATDFETPDWFTGPAGRNIEPIMRQYVLTLLEQQDLFFYTGPYFLDETGARDWAWLNDPRIHFWEAAPGAGMLPDNSDWPAGYSPFGRPLIHQHQWHATSRYVVGEFDRNRFPGTRAELASYGLFVPQRPQEGEVQEPPEGKYTAYKSTSGNPIFVWNMGGQVGPGGILGINVQDLGMTVDSATEPGTPIDRSIQGQEVKPFHDRRQDAGATARPVGSPGQVE
jgi:hypothetical protein